MRAALYREMGEASKVLSVEEMEAPPPGPKEVRVRVSLSGVNPTDWKSRSGMTGAGPLGFQIPHHDGSGVVEALGEEVSGLSIGQRVWLHLAAFQNRYGTAAEASVLPAERAIPLPDAAGDELGACLGVPALTAAHCLGGDPAALEGRSVLVAGGAGAVGHYAIELAKHAGARVAATVSSEEKAALARAAGADMVVNYRQAEATEELRSFALNFDRVIEVALGANLDMDLALSGPGTTIVVYASEAQDPVVPTRRLMGANVSIHYMLLYGVPAEELRAAISWTSDALAAGALSALPTHYFPLEEVAAAQDAVERGAIGKVLLRCG